MLKLTCHMASYHTSTFLHLKHHGKFCIPLQSGDETCVLSCILNNIRTHHDEKGVQIARCLARLLHLMHVCNISGEQFSIREPSCCSSPPKCGSSISLFLLFQNAFRNHRESISLVIKISYHHLVRKKVWERYNSTTKYLN